MSDSIQRAIKQLSKFPVDKYVRKDQGKAEENVKIKLTIPLLKLLGYNEQRDMDFEHHVRNKKADIALVIHNKPRLIVETKDLDVVLDNYIDQALDYAQKKGTEWVILTNGVEIRLYKSFMVGIPQEDRLLFSTTLKELPETFPKLEEYISKKNLSTEKRLKEEAEHKRESITARILVKDLAECKERLFKDLSKQFRERYLGDRNFRNLIDTWAESVGMDPKDPSKIKKLCKEGSYSLINRVLFLRICEDRGFIKPKLSKTALVKWKQMVEKPSHLLGMAFGEIGERFKGLYRSPLFDNIKFEDIKWNEEIISYILNKLGEHDFSKITKDILGKAYEQHISKEERKELGQFYTPDFVINYILDRVNISSDKTILDPACGSGGFLMKAYDRLREMYQKEGWADEKIHQQILSQNLFGIDINPFATQLTIMNLLLKDLDHPTGEVNVVEGDTLERKELILTLKGKQLDLKEPPRKTPLKVLTGEGKEVFYLNLLGKAPFDIVIGNPPYISFGLRGADKITKERIKELKMLFPHSAEYKISIYALFVERALQLLKEKGRLGFILPDSFLLGKYFQGLRKYILSTCKIKEIVLFEKDFWKYGVVGRPVILILEKEPNEKLRKTNKITARYYTARGFKSFSYEQSYFYSEPRLYRFRLFFDKESRRISDKLEIGNIYLSEIVTISSGLIGKKGKKEIINNRKVGKDWLPGLLSGAEMNRYSLFWKGNFILFDKEKLKSGYQEARYFEEKIFLRQTGDDLIGVLDKDNLLCLNNLHVVNLKNKNYDLRYILAILNSRLVNHYYHVISLEKGRAMAQTDIDAIEQIPIKPVSQGEQKEFVVLVNKILELNQQLQESVSKDQKERIQEEIKRIDGQIDRKIFEIYLITRTEQERILQD